MEGFHTIPRLVEDTHHQRQMVVLDLLYPVVNQQL
jgi:hypothetical protein